MHDNFLTISEKCTFESKIQKSRFIANAFPVSSVDEVNHILESIRKLHYDAKHHPYSFVMNDINLFRYNDDGEPSGSSGKPIYDAINKHNLKNIIVIVTRYFGGIKLGVGGLKRAYFDTADECLNICKTKEVILKEKISIKFNYNYISAIMKYLENNKILIAENKSSDIVNLICEVRLSKIESFKSEILEKTNGSAIII
jgi:uncharacterized YigZ family protein